MLRRYKRRADVQRSGLTKKAEEKLWLAFDDTTSGDQYNMHWDRAPCSIEGEYARVPQGRGKEWPGRLILCNLLFEQIAQRTIHNDLELSGGLLRDEAPPGKIAFLGHHTSVPGIILHEVRQSSTGRSCTSLTWLLTVEAHCKP